MASKQEGERTILRVRNCNHRYGSYAALRGVHLDVRHGEFLTLLGASGSGKTTLLKVIAGLIAPTSGDIFIANRDVTRLPIEKRDIGFVFQSYALFPHLTVEENIAFGLRLRNQAREEILNRVSEMLNLVQLVELANRYPNELSGGQQQRVAIARALAPGPTLLLLDEPLGALDRQLRQKLGADLRRIQQETKVTAIYVTHDQEEAFSLSDRIAVMDAGNILQLATPRDLYTRPDNTFIANFVGETCSFSGTLIAQQDVRAEVKVGERIVRATSAAHVIPPGTGVQCVIRPEGILLSPHVLPNVSDTDHRFTFGTGTVHSTAFLGNRERVGVLVNGLKFVAELQTADHAPFQIGDQVDVKWADGTPRVFVQQNPE